MTYTSDLHDYDPPETPEVKEFLAKGRKDQLKGVIEELVNDEFDRLEEYANEYISGVAAHRAQKFLDKVLNGDEDAAMALLGDESDHDRYQLGGCDHGKPWASAHHGSVFETSGIRLRKQIVEAFPELLRNERIADLESIVDGLTQQVTALQRQLHDRDNY